MARVYPAPSHDDLYRMLPSPMASSPTARGYYDSGDVALSPYDHPYHHRPHPSALAHHHAHARASSHPQSPFPAPPLSSVRYDPYTRRPSYALIPAGYPPPPPPAGQPWAEDQWAVSPTGHAVRARPRLDEVAARGRASGKAHETTKPTDKYQPSRGAQRDAKHSQRVHLAQQQAQAAAVRRTPPSRAQAAAPAGPGMIVGPAPLGLMRRGSQVAGTPEDMRMREYQMIQEQQAQIARARYEHEAKRQAAEAKRAEMERKMKMVQMQVFVHARRTPCIWGDCDAKLTSWTLIEKHIYEAHLHPDKKLGSDGSGVRCHWGDCDMVFPTSEECYDHTLVVHMGPFSARCPFDCLYEGPDFTALMAHIERRHPKNTPDDFVPGLRPYAPYIPPLERLPQLPAAPQPSNVDSVCRYAYLDGPVRPSRVTSAERELVGRMSHSVAEDPVVEPPKEESTTPLLTRKRRPSPKTRTSTPPRKRKQSPKAEAKKKNEVVVDLAGGIVEGLRKAKEEHEERMRLGMLTPDPSEEEDADWWKKELTEAELTKVDEQTMPLMMKVATARRAQQEEEMALRAKKGKKAPGSKTDSSSSGATSRAGSQRSS
ncbi:hypothetical protein IAT38_004681 [Cryptococcus sp. DSM 104549]